MDLKFINHCNVFQKKGYCNQTVPNFHCDIIGTFSFWDPVICISPIISFRFQSLAGARVGAGLKCSFSFSKKMVLELRSITLPRTSMRWPPHL